MRTLKKTLSLVLVVAMVLGLCVVGASAYNKVEDFTDDVSKIGDAYYEAVGVLTGIGVIDGMTETAFEPQGNYTREQAAKIIAYMQLGKDKADSLKCTTAPFEDVAATRWSAGYIAYCVEQGIIDGMTETTFEPTAKLTGFQWAKMLLCAVGFGVNGEFTGSSWSVNTAKVAHTVDLFAGDLAGADHVALTREQAALYAFNVLTNVKKVAYSPNVTSYVYGIEGYTTVNGINSTLGEDVYGLHNVVGIIVDNEGMGASATKVSSNYTTTKTVSIKAGTGLDMMYHAARVWYVGTNTGVFTYDLAKTTPYECMNIAAGTKAAATAKATTGLTLGDTSKTAYEAYLIDNSAINAGSAYVTLYADFGKMGYVDTAKKTTSFGGKTYANADVMTDVSGIKYGSAIVYIAATSKTEANAVAGYAYAATATSGVVKSIAKENGVVISVTLDNGTVLPISSLYAKYKSTAAIETYVIGNVYAFVLDTHGDIIYATKDTVRDLWAYTGETKYTNEFSDISSDWVTAYRFINTTTGEEKFAPAAFFDGGVGGFKLDPEDYVGSYFDLSATTLADGRYVAELITKNDNTYAAGYIVGDWTVENLSYQNTYTATSGNGTVYFDGSTVTFLVATGSGKNMTVTPYVGIQALKTAYNVATNGTIVLKNSAMTVSKTSTGAWNASVIFVFAKDLSATSRFVFIPEDISKDDWNSVTGTVGSYLVTYNGAYLEGEKVSLTFASTAIPTMTRGFYELTYNAKGYYEYSLVEKIDNGANGCYYADVQLVNTGLSTNLWKLVSGKDEYRAIDGEVKIVDVTNPTHEIASLQALYEYMDAYDHVNWSLAFTVNPDTGRVDYIYLVNYGWDAKIVVSLSDTLAKAGWVFVDEKGESLGTSITYNDDKAQEIGGKAQTYTIYNEKLKDVDTSTLQYTVKVNGTGTQTYSVVDGKTTVSITPATITSGQKTYEYEISGLEIGDVTVVTPDTGYKFSSKAPATVEDMVLGQTMTVVFTPEAGQFMNGDEVVNGAKYYWTGTYTEPTYSQVENDITGILDSTSTYVTITFCPVAGGNASISGAAWVPYPNA